MHVAMASAVRADARATVKVVAAMVAAAAEAKVAVASAWKVQQKHARHARTVDVARFGKTAAPKTAWTALKQTHAQHVAIAAIAPTEVSARRQTAQREKVVAMDAVKTERAVRAVRAVRAEGMVVATSAMRARPTLAMKLNLNSMQMAPKSAKSVPRVKNAAQKDAASGVDKAAANVGIAVTAMQTVVKTTLTMPTEQLLRLR